MLKKIILNSEKEILSFYKLLPIYNSIFFKYIYFDIENNNDGLRSIQAVLNEKNRKKKLALIIDEACKYVDDYFERKDICEFKNCMCLTQRKNDRFKNGCCRMCIYQSKNGCKTKNVACKLFFCEEVKKRHEVLTFKDIKILNCLSIRQRTLLKSDYFSSKEEVVMDLYFNSLMIGTARMVVRLLVNFYKVNRKYKSGEVK